MDDGEWRLSRNQCKRSLLLDDDISRAFQQVARTAVGERRDGAHGAGENDHARRAIAATGHGRAEIVGIEDPHMIARFPLAQVIGDLAAQFVGPDLSAGLRIGDAHRHAQLSENLDSSSCERYTTRSANAKDDGGMSQLPVRLARHAKAPSVRAYCLPIARPPTSLRVYRVARQIG